MDEPAKQTQTAIEKKYMIRKTEGSNSTNYKIAKTESK